MDANSVSDLEGAWTVDEDAALSRGLPAQAGLELQGQLLSRIGREIKAPLGAVLGFAHLMSQDPVDPLGERHRRWVALIEQAAHYMLSLVNESIDTEGAECAAEGVEDEIDVSLGPLFAEVGCWLEAQALSRGIQVTVEPTSAVVRAHPRALRQVLLNLGSNAIKYNHEGGHVQLAVRPAGELVEVKVCDDGLGMSAAMRAQLFQPYNRLGREDGPVEGTGLGLCIVRQLVERMHGRIEVESEPGRGSTFRVFLPAG